MNTVAANSFPLEVQHKYRDNFARHILSITLHVQSEIMRTLTLKHGHSQLRINYEPFISIAAGRGARLSDIAAMLGVSRQAANQTANQVEAAGYLQRAPDPSDGRAKLLVTTPRARALIRQGSQEASRIQAIFAEIADAAQVRAANSHLVELNRCLGLIFPFEREDKLNFAATLPRLSDYITTRLQTLTMQKGHPQLKRSFGAVLTAIGPGGGRIQQIANRQDVSKQAISAIACELEDIGYITRVPDSRDARQVVLQFTDMGKKLVADSVDSVDELGAELAAHIGEAAFAQLIGVMARLYRSLHLEEDVFGHADTDDIRVIARQLTRQLGEEGARALGRLLLCGESDY